MKQETKANRLYANVLVDVAGAQLDTVSSELQNFSKLFDESPLLLQVFDNPTIGREDKGKAVQELLSKLKLSSLSQRFLSLLVGRNRLGLLPEILKEMESIEVQKKGGLVGELTSAVPIEAAVAKGVADALSKKLQKPVQLKQKVDPSLIAGMRVTIGGTTYDGSVRSRLSKISQNFH